MKKNIFTREIKVGIMVVAAIFILYFGLNFLKGVDIFKPVKYYIATYENIDGLVPSSPVMIRGYKVGQVETVNYDFMKSRPFTVKVSVQKDISLPQGSVMQLFDNGLMGGKAIQLVFEPTTSKNFYLDGDTLQTTIAPGLLAKLSEGLTPKLETIILHADSLLVSLQTLASAPQLHNTLANFEVITSDLSHSSGKLKSLLQNDIPLIVNNFNQMSGNFNQLSANLSKIDFDSTFHSINQTIASLQTLSNKFNSNEGSLGLLLNDKDLYLNLKNTSSDADKLLIDLRQNPKRYVHFSLW
jgi:phospholipid/cholesterol/gamma-HCH transport system substrate-binding protein